VYTYDAVPDAVAQVDELPGPALSAYAGLIAFLDLTPWEGAPYREDTPDGPMRTMPLGKRAEGMAVYVQERRHPGVPGMIMARDGADAAVLPA